MLSWVCVLRVTRRYSENRLTGDAGNIEPADAEIVQFAHRQFLKLTNGRAVTPPIAIAAKKRSTFSSHDRHSLSRIVCFDRYIVGKPAFVQCNNCMADLPETQGRLTVSDCWNTSSKNETLIAGGGKDDYLIARHNGTAGHQQGNRPRHSLDSEGRVRCQQIVGLQFASDFLGRAFKDNASCHAEAVTDVELCIFPRKPFESLWG